ncbi:hypothetical protein STENM327S_07661 [Streptomyces tendae]
MPRRSGQQRRLQIATLVTRPADLLVLDEPTNHIALDLVEDLQTALAAYPGAVVAGLARPRLPCPLRGRRAGAARRPRVCGRFVPTVSAMWVRGVLRAHADAVQGGAAEADRDSG